MWLFRKEEEEGVNQGGSAEEVFEDVNIVELEDVAQQSGEATESVEEEAQSSGMRQRLRAAGARAGDVAQRMVSTMKERRFSGLEQYKNRAREAAGSLATNLQEKLESVRGSISSSKDHTQARIVETVKSARQSVSDRVQSSGERISATLDSARQASATSSAYLLTRIFRPTVSCVQISCARAVCVLTRPVRRLQRRVLMLVVGMPVTCDSKEVEGSCRRCISETGGCSASAESAGSKEENEEAGPAKEKDEECCNEDNTEEAAPAEEKEEKGSVCSRAVCRSCACCAWLVESMHNAHCACACRLADLCSAMVPTKVTVVSFFFQAGLVAAVYGSLLLTYRFGSPPHAYALGASLSAFYVCVAALLEFERRNLMRWRRILQKERTKRISASETVVGKYCALPADDAEALLAETDEGAKLVTGGLALWDSAAAAAANCACADPVIVRLDVKLGSVKEYLQPDVGGDESEGGADEEEHEDTSVGLARENYDSVREGECVRIFSPEQVLASGPVGNAKDRSCTIM